MQHKGFCMSVVANKPLSPAEQNGIELELPPNVYMMDGLNIRLLAPVRVKATHEAFNERLQRLVDDKSGTIRDKTKLVTDSALQDQISELKNGQRQQVSVNETILLRLQEFGQKLDGVSAAKAEVKTGKTDSK